MNRAALFRISYGLYVITSTKANGTQNGFIGNTTFQITSKPPRIALGVSCDNYTYEFINESKLFAVSVLNQNLDPNIIQTFGYHSGRDIDKFDAVDWVAGHNGAPLLKNDINATFECKVESEFNFDTHTIFIGAVTNTNIIAEEATPLTYGYYRNVMKGKAPKNAPTYVEETKSENTGGGTIYKCGVCGFEYDPSVGDSQRGYPPGTQFSDFPKTWTCPVCGSPLEVFSPV